MLMPYIFERSGFMKKLLLLIILSLVFVGAANAGDNNWTPTSLDPNVVLTEAANWDVGTNWSLGSVPTSTQKLGFTIDAVPCLIDSDTHDAVGGQTVIGDNGPDDASVHHVIVEGTLNTHGGAWTSVGYNRWSQMDVERGGAFISEHRVGIGLVGSGSDDPANKPSILNINGGSVDITGDIQIGTNLTHRGIVNVNSGLLEATNLEFRDLDGATNGYWSLLDVSHGTVAVDGDETGLVADLVANGSITAYGGAGTVVYSYDGADTIITATGDPHAYDPEMDEVVPVGPVTLSWNIVEAPPAWATVYFGTNKDTMPQIVPPTLGLTTTGVIAPAVGEYVWRVDILLDNPATEPDPNTVEGTTMYFFASNDQGPDIEMDTTAMATWKDEPTPLQATVYDDGVTPVVVTWTADDPNVSFNPPTNTIPMQPDYTGTGVAVTTDMTCDYNAGTVIVTATATDGNPLGDTDASDASVYVASDPCTAARNPMGLAAEHPADINADCNLDLIDYSVIADEWQTDYAITSPQPIPQ